MEGYEYLLCQNWVEQFRENCRNRINRMGDLSHDESYGEAAINHYYVDLFSWFPTPEGSQVWLRRQRGCPDAQIVNDWIYTL